MSMPVSFSIAFATFAFVMTITPGPNNIMLLTSGANFGLRRTMPHLLGVCIGFSLMVFLVGVGLGKVFEQYPILDTLLYYVSIIYLLYLAWKIVRSGPIDHDTTTKKPLSFLQAAAFQWVNPKAWIMAVASIATYAPAEAFFINVVAIAVLFGFFFAPCGILWAGFGSYLKRFLNQPKQLLIFNVTMAVLLLLSLYPIILDLINGS